MWNAFGHLCGPLRKNSKMLTIFHCKETFSLKDLWIIWGGHGMRQNNLLVGHCTACDYCAQGAKHGGEKSNIFCGWPL
jgi:hypothetical protein